MLFAKSTEPQRGELYAAIRVTVPICKSPWRGSGSATPNRLMASCSCGSICRNWPSDSINPPECWAFSSAMIDNTWPHPSCAAPAPISGDNANPLDQRFLQMLDDESRTRRTSEPIHTGDLKLPELATTSRLCGSPTAGDGRLRRKWEQVQQSYSDVRFSPKGANPGVLLCRGGSSTACAKQRKTCANDSARLSITTIRFAAKPSPSR